MSDAEELELLNNLAKRERYPNWKDYMKNHTAVFFPVGVNSLMHKFAVIAVNKIYLARKEGVKLGASLTLEGLLTQDEKDKNKNWISVVKLAELNAIKNTKVRIAKEISDWIDGEIKAYEGFDRPKRFKEELKQILLGLKRFLSKPQSDKEAKKK